ncbi:NADH-quinone oxidoreductase subunit B [Myxococcota bacterium]|nr:NADH-quinone oxidoreductase subunit B [Myxococcota bacterium]
MSDAELIQNDVIVTRREDAVGWLRKTIEEGLNWGRKYSLFGYPFVTACCAMEYMAVNSPRYDLGRFGAEFPRFSPRQADLLWIVGTISQKQAPILRRVYEQMTEPKWVIAMGACASTGGFYDNYTTVQGADRVIPVDVYIPGCPPRPEQILDGLIMLQDKIQKDTMNAIHWAPPAEEKSEQNG